MTDTIADNTAESAADGTNAAAIINALKDKANETLAASLGSQSLEAFQLGSQGNFYYNWQDSMNVSLFNKLTYNWINSNLKAGVSPIQLDASFTNLYLKAITSISYSLSVADQAALNKNAAATTQQAGAVQNAWLAAFGSFPGTSTNPMQDIAGEIATKWAVPPTTLMQIQSSLNLRALLNNVPAAGQPVLSVFANWLNVSSAVLSLQNSVTLNSAYLARAVAATQTPSAGNGGLQLNDGSLPKPAYQVTTQVSDILNSLDSGVPNVTMTMTVSRDTEDEFKVSVEGHAAFTIPVLDFLGIGVGGNASYFSDNIATTANATTVEMSFPGVNLVTFGPVPFQMAGNTTSWFWIEAIREAIANTGQDISGFKFSPNPGIDFSAAGPFAYLSAVAISNYPTITITTTSDDYQKIQQTFEQSASVDVSFLGISLGGTSESTYSNHVTVDASSQTVTITIAPPPLSVAGTADATQAWVLGVVPEYPGTQPQDPNA